MAKRMNQQLWLLALAFFLLLSSPAQAELYVAGQLGGSIPNSFGNEDLSLKNSFMYGAKLGYYFESLKWLGLETEAYNTTPNVKQQNVTINGQPVDLVGRDFRVLTWAPIMVMVRLPGERFQPYAGVGMGVFFGRVSGGQNDESSSSNQVGLNTQLGLRFLVTKHFSLFGEWKYNNVSLNFSDAGLLNADYSANLFAFGLGWHF